MVASWSVPRGTERRNFLIIWLSLCATNGCNLAGEAHRAWASHRAWGPFLLLCSHVLYVCLHLSLVSCLVFKFHLYARYKIFLDLLHLHYCTVCHILASIYPPSGEPVPPDFPARHCLMLLMNPVMHNLPFPSHVNMFLSALPCHFIMEHTSLAFHLPNSSTWQYMRHMGWTLAMPPVVSTLAFLVVGRTDMPPSAGDGGGARDSLATQSLWLVHHVQLYCQARMWGVLNILSVVVLIVPLAQGLMATRRGESTVEVTFIMLTAVMCASYTLGSQNVMGNLGPKLQGALNLLHDLVPKHVAQALLAQEEQEATLKQQQQQQQPHGSNNTRTSPAVTSSSASQRISTTGRTSPGSADTLIEHTTGSSHSRLGSISLDRVSSPHPNSAGMMHTSMEVDPHSMTVTSQALTTAASALAAEAPQHSRERHSSGALRTANKLLDSFRAAVRPDSSISMGSMGSAGSASIPEALTADGLGGSSVPLAHWHESCSIVFCDIVGFTDLSSSSSPAEVMAMLNELFERYDALCMEGSKVYKVETIGDCIMAATGLLHDDADHAVTAIEFGAGLIREARQVLMPHTGQPVRVRVGVHSGSVLSGVVGRIRKRYCLFGDTVNTASRMESNSDPYRIHVSSATHALVMASPLRHHWTFTCRGDIPVKGKGNMTTYFVDQAAALDAPTVI